MELAEVCSRRKLRDYSCSRNGETTSQLRDLFEWHHLIRAGHGLHANDTDSRIRHGLYLDSTQHGGDRLVLGKSEQERQNTREFCRGSASVFADRLRGGPVCGQSPGTGTT